MLLEVHPQERFLPKSFACRCVGQQFIAERLEGKLSLYWAPRKIHHTEATSTQQPAHLVLAANEVTLLVRRFGPCLLVPGSHFRTGRHWPRALGQTRTPQARIARISPFVAGE